MSLPLERLLLINKHIDQNFIIRPSFPVNPHFVNNEVVDQRFSLSKKSCRLPIKR